MLYSRPATQTHEIAERKMKELEKLRDAWGIDKDAVEGQAFDRELQVGFVHATSLCGFLQTQSSPLAGCVIHCASAEYGALLACANRSRRKWSGLLSGRQRRRSAKQRPKRLRKSVQRKRRGAPRRRRRRRRLTRRKLSVSGRCVVLEGTWSCNIYSVRIVDHGAIQYSPSPLDVANLARLSIISQQIAFCMWQEGEERVRRLEEARAQRRKDAAEAEDSRPSGESPPPRENVRHSRKRHAEDGGGARAGKRHIAERAASPDAGAERWVPRPATPDAEALTADDEEAADADAARQTSADGPSTGILSPTPSVVRSRPPSPSPAKLRAEAKKPPSPRPPSPPRNGRPQKSPPARTRIRRDSPIRPRRRGARQAASPVRRDVRGRDRSPRRDRDERRYGSGRGRDDSEDRRDRGRDRDTGRDGDLRRGRARSASPVARREQASKVEDDRGRHERRKATPPRSRKSPSSSGTSSSSGSGSSSSSSGGSSSGTSSSSGGSGSDSD